MAATTVPSAPPELLALLLHLDGALADWGALGSGPGHSMPAGWMPTLRMLVGSHIPLSIMRDKAFKDTS